MVDSWNEYEKRREQETQKRETITKDSLAEWAVLKGFAKSLAEDGKGVEDFKFQWVPDRDSPCLVLGAVAAYFEHRTASMAITHEDMTHTECSWFPCCSLHRTDPQTSHKRELLQLPG